MPIYLLPQKPIFPNPEEAEPDGLLAIGGDLATERLIEAYSHGVFPWPSSKGPILWWSPPQRALFFPHKEHMPRSAKKAMRRIPFEVKMDTQYRQVMAQCARVPRSGQEGTWITPSMEAAYAELHIQGYAHSVETWLEGRLVGGLYGVSIGAAFFGESMFSLVSYASRAAFNALCSFAWARGFHFIDGQFPNDNLDTLGAAVISRSEFLSRLSIALKEPTLKGKWDATPYPLLTNH